MPPPHHMSPSPSPVAIEPPTRIPNPAPVPPPPVVTEEATVETSAMSGSSSESTSTSTGDTPEPPDKLNGEVNDPDVTSPGPLAEEPVVPTPEEVKEQGNEMFKSKNYTGAIDLYTQAIGEGTLPRFRLFVAHLDHPLDQIYLQAMNRRTLRTERPHIWLSSDSN